MKGVIAALVVTVGLWPGPSEAGTITLHWDPSAGATAYEIERSSDNGVTWAKQGADVLPSACTGTPVRCTAAVTLPATGVHLVRFVAKNAVGRATRFGEGIWHCESCKPPAEPANMGTP